MEQATAIRAGSVAVADRVSRVAVCAVLLAGPAAVAFFTGGVRGDARAALAATAWMLVAVAAVTWRRPPLPRDLGGWLAVGGLGGLAALTVLSAQWAPLRGPAFDDGVRVAGYAGVLLLASSAWPSRRWLSWVEPGLAAGTLVVIGYGLAGWLLPSIELDRSSSAGDLLEQPITYWNAMGAVAAVGIVLCARLVGDAGRPAALSVAAAAAIPVLGTGLYLTGSVGAAAALAVGLALLASFAPGRRQLAVVAVALATGMLAAVAVVALPSVSAPGGDPPQNRPEYWSVALETFADHPLAGAGAGSFQVEWARERTVDESVRDAHSLYVETAAELGLAGLALLATLMAGVALAARRARRRDPAGVAGMSAALATLAVHAGLDWDWEVPAVTSIALVLAGGLVASASAARPD